MSVRLGELLTKASLITQDQLKEALRVQKETGSKLGETLIRLGFVSEEDITECLSQQFGVPSINLQHFEIDGSVIKLIPGDVARKYNILPVNKTGATVTIAMADPTNVFAMDDIKFMTGYNVEPVVASELGIKAAIDNYYGSTSSLELKKVMEDLQQAESADLEVLEDEEELDMESLAESAEEAPVPAEDHAKAPAVQSSVGGRPSPAAGGQSPIGARRPPAGPGGVTTEPRSTTPD